MLTLQKMKRIFLIPLFILENLFAQVPGNKIMLNQIGFYPNAPKMALITGENINDSFYIISENRKDTLLKGILNKEIIDPYSNKKTRIANFSKFNKEGRYVLAVTQTGISLPFSINAEIFKPLAIAAIKGYYFQRASISLEKKYAGKWMRKEGHPDNLVLIHPSAAGDKRVASSKISSSKGWYDAGDYNKYIVNSGITMGTLFSLYEDQPQFFKNLNTNIPESGNEIPDLLDECLWNLRWMLTMQDPNDGGVYHKLTNANFDAMVMPSAGNAERYVVAKSTTATLDFVANMAQASRIFKNYKLQAPGLADSCLLAATKAWEWALKNPDILYEQDEMNKKYKPSVVTGGYEDKTLSDEWSWAATELYITTKNEKFGNKIGKINALDVPSWSDVKTLGYYSILRFEKEIPVSHKNDVVEIKKLLFLKADELINGVEENYSHTVMVNNKKNFIWGSNAVAANQSILLLQAYKISKEKKYIDFALSNLDYILGRNMTGFSFVTGYGSKTPMHIHHRPSEADGIMEPIPGLLAGGVNPGQQDKCEYATHITDECYNDNVCSYSTNEIAINWNAPLVYLTCAMEVLWK